jgi:hypothetical protein
VEQQVPAATGAEEIALGQRLTKPIVGDCHHVLPEAPDVAGIGPITAFGDQRATRHHVASRQLAVETDLHHAVRPQHREQRAPSLQRVLHVVQHAARLDHVE